MKPITMSNALVGVVGAYAEALAEQAQTIEQLQIAIRDMSKQLKPAAPPVSILVHSVVDVARALVDPTTRPRRENIPPALDDLLSCLAQSLDAFDKAGAVVR